MIHIQQSAPIGFLPKINSTSSLKILEGQRWDSFFHSKSEQTKDPNTPQLHIFDDRWCDLFLKTLIKYFFFSSVLTCLHHVKFKRRYRFKRFPWTEGKRSPCRTLKDLQGPSSLKWNLFWKESIHYKLEFLFLSNLLQMKSMGSCPCPWGHAGPCGKFMDTWIAAVRGRRGWLDRSLKEPCVHDLVWQANNRLPGLCGCSLCKPLP